MPMVDRITRLVIVVVGSMALMSACRTTSPSDQSNQSNPTPTPTTAKLTLSSPSFVEGAAIPARFTCDGENISPALAWGPAPKGTESWALIMEDPDAPGGTWSHWVALNIPVSIDSLGENQPHTGALPNGGQQVMNDFKRPGYGGPCPPGGTHHYVFRLFALDMSLPNGAVVDRKELLEAIKGRILAEATVTAIYHRAGK
ncbi:MAG: YbhB/YbcL family Raf kinase inhibitor-like protein [Pyrinomonadaceae bacterium]